MSKLIEGGSSSSSGSGTYTDNYSSLTANVFTNTTSMTSPSATITAVSATTVAATGAVSGGSISTAGSITGGSVSTGSGTISTTGTVSAGSVSATGAITGGSISAGSGTISTTGAVSGGSISTTSGTITSLTAPTIGTTNLTASNSITTNDLTVSGTLSFNGSLDYTSFSTQTMTIGSEAVSFPTQTSEYDATSIVYDTENKFATFTDKRTSLAAAQTGTDLSISIDDPITVAVDTANGINGMAAIEWGGQETSYLDTFTSNTASSTNMTVVIVFRKADECDTIVSYEAAQPSFNCTGGVLYLEHSGNYNINTGISIANLTSYILVATLSTTAGITIRINGVQQFSDTTSYSATGFNTGVAYFGRHYTDTAKWFFGRIGNVMTAPKILTATEIDNIETYLSSKFDIATGATPTVKTGDPFSTGNGSCTVYGEIDSVSIVADTLAVSGETTLYNLTLENGLSAQGVSYMNEVITQILTSNGVYYETISASTKTSANLYSLSYAEGGIFYISGVDNPTANFSVYIQNIPTDATQVYTISLVYYQTSTAYYCNAISASDTDGTYLLGGASTYATPKFSGGTPSFTTTPNLVIQQFSILSFPNSSGITTRYVVSSISSYY